MANIRITCPTCGKTLEVGAEYDGKEVECGECFQVFVAKGPGGGKIKGAPSARGSVPAARPEDKPKSRRCGDEDDYEHDRRGDEYDDDDYEPPRRGRRGGGSRGGGGGESGTAVAGLIGGVFA